MKTPHGTQEWAASNVNIQDGCEHDCLYCYAKQMAIRFKRAIAGNWREPHIRSAALDKGFSKRRGRIMFPTAHDITPDNIDASVLVLRRMLAAGNDVLIVSKPHAKCVRRICQDLITYRHQILFRFTIGSADDTVLTFWEPGAPPYEERLDSLLIACFAGYQTSISCEPMLDPNIHAVISDVRPLITDAIWLGKANRLSQIVRINCPGNPEALERATALVKLQSDEYIHALYRQYQGNPLIKWKDSIKKVVGLQPPPGVGLDI